MKPSKPLVLVSGGIDSTTLVYKLISEKMDLSCIIYNYGQNFFEKELESIHKALPPYLLDKLKIVDISFLYKNLKSPILQETDLWTTKVTREDMYLPCRNLIFYALATSYAKQNENDCIYSGFIDGDRVVESDATLNYLNDLSKFMQDNEKIPIINPFINMSKKSVILLAMNLGVPIENTYSCQISNDMPCGACPNCVDRNDAFEEIFLDAKP